MTKKIVTKSEKVPILGIFSPKTILMFRVGLKKIRVGRQTGTTHIFHLSLMVSPGSSYLNCFDNFDRTLFPVFVKTE